MNKISLKLKNLFGANKVEDIEEEMPEMSPAIATQELPTKPLGKPIGQHLSSMIRTQLNAGSAQSVGRQRDHNEDALLSITSMLSYNDTTLPMGLYIVADGMGGHQHGEIASELAVRALAEHVLEKLYTPLFNLIPHQPESSIQEILQDGILAANQAILQDAGGGGTTVTTVLIVGNQMTIAHVGDSRVYAVSLDGHLESLTRDHSLVRRLQELGQISPEEAAVHPQRNVLYRALGQGDTFEPELISTIIPSPGSLLLCSDGLWNVLDEQMMSSIIFSNATPQQACQELVQAANDAGGPDNISVILIDLPN